MSSNSISNLIKNMTMCIALFLVLCSCMYSSPAEAKFLRRSRYMDEGYGGYDSPYGGSMAVPTGERAIVTVRGARNPYDGTAPSKITIEDNPYRGPYPSGIYDRLDGYNRRPMYPRGDMGYSNPYGGYGGYNSG